MVYICPGGNYTGIAIFFYKVSHLKHPNGHPNMFATAVDFKRGEYQDPCAGDGGGPLMKRAGGRWVLLGKFWYTYSVWNQIFRPWYVKKLKTSGTLQGGGYDCRNGELVKDEKGRTEGIWNWVSGKWWYFNNPKYMCQLIIPNICVNRQS